MLPVALDGVSSSAEYSCRWERLKEVKRRLQSHTQNLDVLAPGLSRGQLHVGSCLYSDLKVVGFLTWQVALQRGEPEAFRFLKAWGQKPQNTTSAAFYWSTHGPRFNRLHLLIRMMAGACRKVREA